MGNSNSQNSKIEKQIEKDRQRMVCEYKVLLLGTGATGKSTVLKQIRLLNNIDDFDREKTKYDIVRNTVQTMIDILNAMDENGTPAYFERNKKLKSSMTKYEAHNYVNQLITVSELWKDPAVRSTFQKLSHRFDNSYQ
jgi:septin family protein